MSEPIINLSLPEFVQQVQTLAEQKKNNGATLSFVRIADSTRNWIWREGHKTAPLDIQEGMLLNQSDSIKQIIGLQIQIDNSLEEFQFMVG